MKAKELGLEIDGKALLDVVGQLKQLEHEGYHFEAADGSLELLMRRATGWAQDFFRLESFRVINDENGPGTHRTEATVKVHVDGRAHRSRPPRATVRSTRSTRHCARPSAPHFRG